MRIVATEYLSLDGYFHEPGQWSRPFFNDEAGQFKWAELQASDALLLGRKTYEGFAAAWPGMRAQTGEFGEKMNDMPKYVVSATLSEVTWSGSKLIGKSPIDEIRKLKAEPGQDLLLAGSGQLFNALFRANLIDRYRFPWCTRSCSERALGCSKRARASRCSRWSRRNRSRPASWSRSTNRRSAELPRERSASGDDETHGAGQEPRKHVVRHDPNALGFGVLHGVDHAGLPDVEQTE